MLEFDLVIEQKGGLSRLIPLHETIHLPSTRCSRRVKLLNNDSK